MTLSKGDRPTDSLRAETRLVVSGRDTASQKGFVNPPIVRGSTVLYPTASDLYAHRGEFQYGRHGTSTRALQDALAALEGPQCAGIGLVPGGVRDFYGAIVSVKAGDHVLVATTSIVPRDNSATDPDR